MFNISSDTLHFKNGETTHSLKIDNSSNSWMIFKASIYLSRSKSQTQDYFQLSLGKVFSKRGKLRALR